MHVLTSLCGCADTGEANVTKLATKFNSKAANTERVRMVPVQFHFHTRSEHVLDGEQSVSPGFRRTTTMCQTCYLFVLSCSKTVTGCERLVSQKSL